MSAMVSASGAVFEPGSPRDIIRSGVLNFQHSGGPYQEYDVSADGQRILAIQLAGTSGLVAALAGTSETSGPDVPYSITVAMNWPSSIKK